MLGISLYRFDWCIKVKQCSFDCKVKQGEEFLVEMMSWSYYYVGTFGWPEEILLLFLLGRLITSGGEGASNDRPISTPFLLGLNGAL